MAQWSPFIGRIKVYETADGSDAHWAQPRRVHLHEKEPSGKTLCCSSVTAGGIVEDPDQWIFWLTSDKFVPESESELEQHADTKDENCDHIGYIRHTNRNLHYTLIDIPIDSIGRSARARIEPISSDQAYRAAIHPVLVKDQHRKYDLAVMTRSRNREIMVGHIISLPSKVARPAYMGTGELMVAEFLPTDGSLPSKIDIGTWLYVRKPTTSTKVEITVNDLKDEDGDVTIIRVNDANRMPLRLIPVVLLGHIVDVREANDQDGSARVTIQGAYQVLTEMFVRRGKLKNPDGIERGPVGTDTSSIST
ncbi:hypothetical protein F5B19DRAFT_502076 [Rostrohypoxylon terebratum]|nr:hypothetical protein F5B19DRAFT_502076 [Rostrohypoxylon terebratum]